MGTKSLIRADSRENEREKNWKQDIWIIYSRSFSRNGTAVEGKGETHGTREGP